MDEGDPTNAKGDGNGDGDGDDKRGESEEASDPSGADVSDIPMDVATSCGIRPELSDVVTGLLQIKSLYMQSLVNAIFIHPHTWYHSCRRFVLRGSVPLRIMGYKDEKEPSHSDVPDCR